MFTSQGNCRLRRRFLCLYHGGSDADVEGTECFDGSVHEKLIDVESHESWRTRLQYMLGTESREPIRIVHHGVCIVVNNVTNGKPTHKAIWRAVWWKPAQPDGDTSLRAERYERGEQIYDETDNGQCDC